MLEQLIMGFGSVFSDWFTVLLILVGVLIGLTMGSIPGLTGNMAVALLIPLTYAMPPVAAVSFLIAITKAGTFGGSIPAILINTPGTPAATATAMDGYELAKKGKALKAMKMALHASTIGDLFSNFVLVLVAAQLAKVALKFGPVERFALIVFALTIIGMVSGKSLPKGLLSAGIGLLLATIGMDPIVGFPRFDFDNINLSGGIGFVPLMIGLFGIAEVLKQVEERKKPKNDGEKIPPAAVLSVSSNPDDSKVTFSELKKCIRTIFRSCTVGTFIGILPGLGASVAAWLGYGMAQKASKNPETFGKGNIEGVAAAEAANNAVDGANLIPLLTLGIPGNNAAALIAGALMIHGLPVGPMIFEKAGSTVYAIFAAAFITIAAYWLIGLYFIRCGVILTKISREYLFPIITVICVMGVYTINTNLFDVGVMMAAGGLGYSMRKFSIPLPPLIIGFLLGPEAEMTLRHTMMLSQGSIGIFFHHPIALIFLAITAITVVKMMLNKKKGD
jgi:putative tricarboxylic transport membrane protein